MIELLEGETWEEANDSIEFSIVLPDSVQITEQTSEEELRLLFK